MVTRNQTLAVLAFGGLLLTVFLATQYSTKEPERVVAPPPPPDRVPELLTEIASLKKTLQDQDADREAKHRAVLNEVDAKHRAILNEAEAKHRAVVNDVNALRKEVQDRPPVVQVLPPPPPPEPTPAPLPPPAETPAPPPPPAPKPEVPMVPAPSMEKVKKVQIKNLWSRPLGASSAHHAIAQIPTFVDYIEVYTHVTELPGMQNIFFAYRDSPCHDWNKVNPTELFVGNVMGAIRASIPRGGVALDIGACYGDTAVPMAALIADRVIAFEPNPKSFAVLDFNAKMNPGLKIETHQFAAAGDANTTSLDFTFSGQDEMCNGGVFDAGNAHQHTEKHFTLPATHIPTFLEKTYGADLFDEITFIKIDAEGFDAHILKTLKPILKRNPKIIVMVEWFDHFKMEDPDAIHPKSQELFDVIEEMGYDPYEPYSMGRVTPHQKHKIPDVTLLPKGTKPWKGYAFDADTFSAKARPNRAKSVKVPVGADVPAKLEAPASSKTAVVKQVFGREPNSADPHKVLMVPAFVDFVEGYMNVSTDLDKSTVLFAYRDTPCTDWNRQYPEQLFTGNVISAIRASIPRGGTVIDIGACYGDTAVPMSATIADRVIAFEPNPKSFAVLDFNAKMNPGLKIEAHNYAAAGDATTTSLDFTFSGENEMCNGGVFDPANAHQHTEKHFRLPATHIPTYLEKTYGASIFDEITFIKIDAEGFDPYILKTLKPIFKRNPKIIAMVEWFDHFKVKDPEGIHPKSQELFDIIDEMGFDPYEPYSMTRSTPHQKNKIPDITLLPKGTKPWKPFV